MTHENKSWLQNIQDWGFKNPWKSSSIIIILFFLTLSTFISVDNGNSIPTPDDNIKINTEIENTSEDKIIVPIEEIDNSIEESTTEVLQTNEVKDKSSYKVTSVVDGDTAKVSIDGKDETIRIIGINTPETVDPRKPVECFGKEASNKAKELLSGKTVVLIPDNTQGDRDKYGRLLRYIQLPDGRDYGKVIISEGYAYEYTYNTPYKYQKEYKSAQSSAKTNQKGLWSPNTCNGESIVTVTTTTPQSSSAGKYYTSSAGNASKYYPENCSAWEGLSKTYLKSFNSLDELLKAYPNRVLAEVCK